jgi:hypothetical protein
MPASDHGRKPLSQLRLRDNLAEPRFQAEFMFQLFFDLGLEIVIGRQLCLSAATTPRERPDLHRRFGIQGYPQNPLRLIGRLIDTVDFLKDRSSGSFSAADIR